MELTNPESGASVEAGKALASSPVPAGGEGRQGIYYPQATPEKRPESHLRASDWPTGEPGVLCAAIIKRDKHAIPTNSHL